MGIANRLGPQKDGPPVPAWISQIDHSVDVLFGSCGYSMLKLTSGYWQIEYEVKDQPQIAFTTGSGLLISI